MIDPSTRAARIALAFSADVIFAPDVDHPSASLRLLDFTLSPEGHRRWKRF
jgi:hypothetical protein